MHSCTVSEKLLNFELKIDYYSRIQSSIRGVSYFYALDPLFMGVSCSQRIYHEINPSHARALSLSLIICVFSLVAT